MKNLSLFVSAFALCASTSYAAINCGTLPTCESLGYTDTISQCPNKSIKCPFDTAKGTCLHEAAVGEVAYFAGPKEVKGWLPCDGKTYPRAKYPELAAFLDYHPTADDSSKRGNPFCNNKYHASSCSSDTFAVPDYRGYFLKVTGMWDGKKSYNIDNFVGKPPLGLATAAKAPQAEELPNITANWRPGQFSGNIDAHGAVYSTADSSDERGGNSRGAVFILMLLFQTPSMAVRMSFPPTTEFTLISMPEESPSNRKLRLKRSFLIIQHCQSNGLSHGVRCYDNL